MKLSSMLLLGSIISLGVGFLGVYSLITGWAGTLFEPMIGQMGLGLSLLALSFTTWIKEEEKLK